MIHRLPHSIRHPRAQLGSHAAFDSLNTQITPNLETYISTGLGAVCPVCDGCEVRVD